MKRMGVLPVAGAVCVAIMAMSLATISASTMPGDSNSAASIRTDASASRIQPGQDALSRAISNVPDVRLKPLGTIDFSGNDAVRQESPIHDVEEFGIDAQGRIGFPAEDCNCNPSLVLIDRSGKVLRSFQLSSLKGTTDAVLKARWIEGDRWIVQAYTPPYGPTSAAFLVDLLTGTSTPIPGFDAPLIQSIAGTHNGGFVTLNYFETQERRSRHLHTLHAYDAAGKQRWTVLRGDDDAEASDTDSVIVTTGGRIVVYESDRDKMVWYDQAGQRVETLDLQEHPVPERPLPQRPSVVTGGVFGERGSNSDALLVSPSGKPIGRLYPSYADGHRFQLPGGVQVDSVRRSPDGRLWASDGESFMRLDSSGRADRTVGRTYDSSHLENVETLTVSSTGRIYAVDARSKAVHVFDRDGTFLHVLFPDPRGTESDVLDGSLIPTGTDDLYVHLAASYKTSQEFVHFSPSGDQVGIVTLPPGSHFDPADTWLPQPGSSNRWAVDAANATLVDPNGRILHQLEPAEIGFSHHDYFGASAAPDGSLLVRRGVLEHATDGARRLRETGLELARISPSGDVTAEWPVAQELRDSHDMVFDGDHVVFLLDDMDDERPAHVLVTDPTGKPLYRFQPARAFYYSKIFIVRRGGVSELWIWIHDGKQTIDRYQLR